MREFCISFCVFLLIIQEGTASPFHDGHKHYFTYHATSHVLGLHNLDTIIKFHVIPVNRTEDGSMNLLKLDSYVQHSDKGYIESNPKHWDLSRSFLFHVTGSGEVSRIFHHPDEEYEVLTIKKLLAGTMSMNKQASHLDTWNYDGWETDHHGKLFHTYTGSREAGGTTFTRRHNSSDHVHRFHEKTISYDHDGILKSVKSTDTIKLYNKAGSSDSMKKEKNVVIIGKENGEFPSISSTSDNSVKLTARRRIAVPTGETFMELKSDSPESRMAEKKGQRLQDVEQEVAKLMECVRSYTDKYNTNRTECSHHLTRMYNNLTREDRKLLAERHLGRCESGDRVCSENRAMMLDLVCGRGDEDSQKLVLKYILQDKKTSDEDIHAVLYHYINMKRPIKESVVAVEQLCFQGNYQVAHTEELLENQMRACLALGGMASSLANNGEQALAEEVLEKLENKLGIYNDTLSKPIVNREKRSIHEFDEEQHNHIITKMVLLHSLGNAGMSRSLRHIRSYLEPNQGASAWRRAAANSLRYFKCNESALALFDVLAHDDNEHVYNEAREVYIKHPQRSGLDHEKENILLSRRYNYHTVARVKRDVKVFTLEVLDGFGFRLRIQAPGIKWSRTIGTSNVGSLIGLNLVNTLDIKLHPLNSWFRINVDNEAYSRTEIGMINKHIEISRAKFCYVGHVGYNLNVLKDFSIDHFKKLLDKLNDVIHKITSDVKEAVELFKKITSPDFIRHLFDEIIKFVKNLPNLVKQFVLDFVELVKKVLHYHADPVIEKVKLIGMRIKAFAEEVKQDALEFYHSIADAVMITLPNVGKMLKEAGGDIISVFKDFFKSPTQSFSKLEQVVIRVQLAVSMVIDAKNRIVDACFFTKGTTPFWMRLSDEISVIIGDIKDLIALVVRKVDNVLHPSAHRALPGLDNNGIMGPYDMKSWFHEETHTMLANVTGSMTTMKNATEPFFMTFHDIMSLVVDVKNGYETVKTVIHVGKSLIQRLFGGKFHKKFPSRLEGNDCTEGVWPSNGKDRFKTFGVDISVYSSSQMIVNPVTGIVKKSNSSELTILPTDSHFRKYVIILNNIIPNSTITSRGQRITAGTIIGHPGNIRSCPNFIHLAMYVRHTSQALDPSKYLHKRIPLPKWITDCNERSLTILGKTYQAGGMSKEPTKEHDDYSSKHFESMTSMSQIPPDNSPPYRPDGVDSQDSRNMAKSFGDQLSPLKNIGEMMMNLSRKIPKVQDFFDINAMTVTTLRNKLKTQPNILNNLDAYVQDTAACLKEVPVVNPSGMSLFKLRMLTQFFKLNVTGDRLAMVNALRQNAMEGCPNLTKSVMFEFGHYCTAHSDCQGMTCGAVFEYSQYRKTLQVDIRHCGREIVFTILNTTHTIPLLGETESFVVMPPDSLMDGLYIKFRVRIAPADDRVSLSVSGAICAANYGTCLPQVGFIQGAEFSYTNCSKAEYRDPFIDQIHKMSVRRLMSKISQCHLDMTKALSMLNDIRNALLNQMFGASEGVVEKFQSEFEEKTDSCIKKMFPEKTRDMTFFIIKIHFMVGPIPMVLEFGAGGRTGKQLGLDICFMSMKLTGRLIPSAALKVWGELDIDIGIAFGGLRLTGYIMTIKFPITGTIGFAKFPLELEGKLDMELVPLRLVLDAFAKLRLLFVNVEVFNAPLWKYSTSAIRKNILKLPNRGHDQSPPSFAKNAASHRERRETDGGGCEVKQLEGRDPSDTAFLLEVTAVDDVSDVKTFYAIGTHSGGTDVVGFTEIAGNSLTMKTDLTNGVPLYWTVKARNSGGGEAVTQCMLHTYDNTPPDGRVDDDFRISSNPFRLGGTVVVLDDSNVDPQQQIALGLSAGEHGSELDPWSQIQLENTTERKEETTDLKFFSLPKIGRLTAEPIKSTTAQFDYVCAKECVSFGQNCVSFDYDYNSRSCDFHNVGEGPSAQLRVHDSYKSFERLGVGKKQYKLYTNLNLTHGETYFINAHIKNELGYRSFLSSHGTLVDLTPPAPGPVGEALNDDVTAEGCSASILQRCKHPSNLPNHRKIIDGTGSNTVFNGGKRLNDEKYSLANNLLAGNWDGFHDNETDIYGYTWGVGTKPCSDDVVKFNNPHANLPSKEDWTFKGIESGLQLRDGPYYTTVQAINNVIHGGALVTTVCHSQPLIVDTTPPDFRRINDLFFDEDFELLGLYYNGSDDLSKINQVHFGLGRTKNDVNIRSYMEYQHYGEDKPYILVEDFELKPGQAAWPRLRLTNNVGLSTSGHAEQPLIVDDTAPVAGVVSDGNVDNADLDYQSDDQQICAQWQKFYDSESGIQSFMWGVGTSPGSHDVVTFRSEERTVHRICSSVQLHHNTTYYSTIIAYNTALNQKKTNTTSDGVLVDTTDPVIGWIKDGDTANVDIDYSAETALVQAVWGGFSDPESGIWKYEVDIFINGELRKTNTFMGEPHQDVYTMNEKTLDLHQGDRVHSVIRGYNGARTQVTAKTDGFVIDLTPPVVYFVRDNPGDNKYQTDKTTLRLSWKFEDDESGMDKYQVKIMKDSLGMKTKIWPTSKSFEEIPAVTSQMNYNLTKLNLEDGARYFAHVVAFNKAKMSKTADSTGVMIDSSPPIMELVHIGPLKEDEEIENGTIVYTDNTKMTVSWRASDPDSGISDVYVALGIGPHDQSLSHGFVHVSGGRKEVVVKDLDLQPSEPNGSYYYVQVKVKNGAGVMSSVLVSKPINVLQGNVPGVIFDGRKRFVDSDFSHDLSTFAMSFAGFQSVACGIVAYEWGIGTEPFVTDIVGFTSFGIVKTNQSSGFGQMNIQLFEGVKYFTTVRARTGHRCHEDYIVATSDGLTADTKGPTVQVVNAKGHFIPDIKSWGVIFQNETDIIEVNPHVTDPAGVNITTVCLGTRPYGDNLHPCQTHREDTIKGLALNPGTSVFVTIKTKDNADNEATWESLPLIPDTTPPEIINLTCTGDVSVASTLISCSWDQVNEYESHLKSIKICVGEAGKSCNLIPKEEVPIRKRSWSVDLYRVLNSTSTGEIFVTVQIVNSMNKDIIFTREITHDETPPLKGDILIVTNANDDKPSEDIPCQVTRSYVEVLVKDFKDEETGIDSCQVSLGTEPGTSNIHPFKKVDQSIVAFFGKLSLQPGDEVYATARCKNKAGLSTTITSDPVAISPHPVLTVLDGLKQQDEDYQTDLTTLQGSWHYSEGCPIMTVEWQILTVSWDIVQDFTSVDSDDQRFYSDELHLSASVTYINVIKVTDALNRVRIAYSDGITVAIAPPKEGSVRDGVDNDVDYQTSTTELWVNWDMFGDSNSSDATQQIERYEVAVGDDVRNPESRFNIRGFQSVQLKTFYTFTNLSLTPKTVTYYITVRAYSKAGSFQEATSDGIKVGFDLDIAPGIIDLHPFTNSLNKMTISWSKFYSDIGITKYSVGLSNEMISMPNETSSCNNMKALVSKQNITLVSSRNLLLVIKNLTLVQGKLYYVIVIAHDKTDSCISVTKGPTTVDVTPPKEGKIIIEGQDSRIGQFVQDQDRLTIQWKGFDDKESGIHVFKISLFQSEPCKSGTIHMLKTMDVQTSTVTTMYKLNLAVGYLYHVQVTAVNNAGRNVSAKSSLFQVDTSPPLSGTIKIGSDWHDSLYFQNKEDSVEALTGFARNERGKSCKKMKQLFPKSEQNKNWSEMEPGQNEGTLVDQNYARIALTYDHTLTEIIAGGLYMTVDEALKEGNYSFRMKSARGENIITSIHFHFGDMREYRPPKLLPLPEQQPADAFVLEDSTSDANESASTNETKTEDSCLPGPGIAVFYYGAPDDNLKWKARWCVQDDSKHSSEWFDLLGDPSDYLFETSIQLIQNIDGIKKSWKANLFYEENIKVRVDGYTFSGHPTIIYRIDTTEDYKPPVGDPLHPFFTQAVLSKLAVPDTTDKDCLHGDPFYDQESGIKEIWMGISSNKSVEDDIVPYTLKASYCMPCKSSCTEMCNSSCSLDDLPDFSVLKMQLDSLHLGHSEKGNMTDSNSSAIMDFKAPTYYVNIKAVNFADQATVSTSNAFQVDITPPVFRNMMCVDPTHSLDEPSDFIGSNSSIGAFWDCDEDVSEIAEYLVEIGSTEGGNDVLKATSVDLRKKVGLTLQDTTLKDGEVYYVTATVVNAAGLTAKSSCNVTVMLGGPGTSRMYSQAMFSFFYTKSTWVSLTNAQDAIGLQIHGANNIFYYEWKTGTSPTKDDIFPAIQVATRSNPAELSIQKGQLWVDGKISNISLSDYRNDTEEEHGGSEELLLFLEPGRCVYHNLHAVGKSHLTSEIRTQPACIKRQKDILIEVEPKEQQFNLTKEEDSSTSPHGSLGIKVAVSASGTNGSVIMGRLNSTDTRRLYGSAATADYVSFITSPGDTLTATNRLLYGRLVRPRDVEFFVGPAPEVHLTVATLTLHTALSTASGNKNELLLWNKDLEMWELPCENDDQSNFKICPKGVKDQVKDIHVTEPQMFALFEIKKDVFNTAPMFITKSITTEEDHKISEFIEVYDKEDDSLSVTIKEPSHHGQTTLDDDGYLTFEPEEDFCGQDKLVLEVKEENVPAGAKPHAVLQELTIKVVCVNDPPELHFVSAEDDVFSAGVKDTINIDIDSSKTSNQTMLGYFALSDNDASDQLELIFDSGAADGIDLVLTNATSNEYLKQGHVKPVKAKTTAYYGVWINNAGKSDQNKTIKFRVKDGHKMHSNPISLKVALKKSGCAGAQCSAMKVEGVKENKAKKFEERNEDIVTPPPHLFQSNYLGTGHLSVDTSNTTSRIIIMSRDGIFSKGQETSKANEGHQVFKVSGKLTISYPNLKGNNSQDIRTDNLLAKRIPIRQGMPFTISLEAKHMAGAHIDVKVLSRKDNLTRSHLLVKEQDGVYRQVPRLCNNTRGGLFDDDQDILTMCPRLLSAMKQRFSPTVDTLTLQVAIFSVKENQPPYLVDSVITMKEGDQLYVQLKAKDPEGDKFIFKVIKNAEEGYADVDTTGNIFYTPSPHFSGEDRVSLQLQETSVPDGSPAKVVDTVLLIKVLSVNDPPVLYYLPPHSGQFRIEDKAKVEINIERFRPFTSSSVDLGFVAAADWDVGDIFNYNFTALNKTTHFFEVQEVTLPGSVWSSKLSDIRRLPEKKSSKILLNFTSDFEGTLLFDVTVKDAEGAGVELDLIVNVTIKQCNTTQACSDHVTAHSDNS